MKRLNMKNIIFSTLFLTLPLLSNDTLFDKDIEEILSTESEMKADIGSRDGARNHLEANSAIDVVTAEQIEHSGLTSLVDVLRYYVAGFNAPETSVADGSDHVRAYTLRGMSADQILVLVNGKRLHTSALLHVNGTIGRGSSHVDLDTVAVRSIDRVEILRDGAAAQYGSDAIAGVINIILKGMGHKSSVSVHSGQRTKGDGQTYQVDSFVSIPLAYDGFVNITAEYKKQRDTQRAGKDDRLAIPSVKTHAGIPESKNYKAMLFSEIPLDGDVNIYTQALFNKRDSEASTFYRPPSVDSSSNPVEGFLPLLRAKIIDYSATVGIKGEFSDSTSWDLSSVYGESKIDYYVDNSMNYSLPSPSAFDNGSLKFSQSTTTLDIKRDFENFKLAGGAEYRHENYTIEAGDISSYTRTGSEGFAGYDPMNEVDEDRDSYALYLDGIYNITEKLMLEMAVRYEDYSDFDDSTTGKLALSYKLIPQLMFRSSISSGFRAPSLAQSQYSQTSSYVDTSGVLSAQGTFKTDHAVAKSFGAKDLTEEKSDHFTLGAVYQPTKNTSLTIDYFYIKVKDKIMLTPELSARTPQQQLVFAQHGVSKARFFINAADTRTTGVDIKLDYKHLFSNNSELNFRIWYNYAKNEIINSNYKSAATNDGSIKTMIEEGQPNDSWKFLTTYEYKKIYTTLNVSRYGSYSQMMDNHNYKFDAQWSTDLDIAYKITPDFKVAVGGQNIFDTLPDKWDGLNGTFYGSNGIKSYSRYSPVGYSGAYYYVRASYEF